MYIDDFGTLFTTYFTILLYSTGQSRLPMVSSHSPLMSSSYLPRRNSFGEKSTRTSPFQHHTRCPPNIPTQQLRRVLHVSLILLQSPTNLLDSEGKVFVMAPFDVRTCNLVSGFSDDLTAEEGLAVVAVTTAGAFPSLSAFSLADLSALSFLSA